MQGIYMIRNKVNRKVYIGKAINIENRWEHGHIRHLRKSRHINTHLQCSWNKYGEESFEFLVIEEIEKEKQNEREKYWIKHCNSNNPAFGFNKTEGGDGGVPNEETILKLKESKNTKEYLFRNRDIQTGKPLPLYLSNKIKESKKENFKQFSQEEINDIVDRRKNGEYYINIANDYGVCYNIIRKIVLENNPEESIRKLSKNTKSRSNGNFKLSDDDVRDIRKLLNEGNNYEIIAKKFNVSKATIKRIRIGTHYNWVN